MSELHIDLEKQFDDSDWASLHDCVLNATWKTTKDDLSRDELIQLFKELPRDIQCLAVQWGMGDTPFRDDVYVWYKENRAK